MRKIIIYLIIIVVISSITFYIGKQIGLNTDSLTTNTTIEEVKAQKRTITKTISSSGEIQTANSEKLELDTSKYFELMCVEEDDTVQEGENILKYTDGTYLVAPYTLVVSAYDIPQISSICTTSNYIEVKDLTNLVVDLTINENEISNISLNQEVSISLTADTSKTYTGKISKISSVGTYQSSGSTFDVEVSFINDGNSKIGMSVTCEIKVEELKDAVSIPINAVFENGTKKNVNVVKNGEITEVEIQTGLSDDEYVEVKSGLSEGDIVQVITITKQNTIRSDNTSNSSKRGNQGGNPGENMESRGGNMPSGSMPEKPSTSNNK